MIKLNFKREKTKNIFKICNINKFFVMGERFFCTSFSETKSVERPSHVEPRASREVCLKRH